MYHVQNAKRSFSHRPGREASQQNIEEENSDDVEIEDDLIEKRRKRGRTKLKRPPNGQEIPIRPNGDE